ncbi:carbohydrate ABC transporter permease [soil metagenome]
MKRSALLWPIVLTVWCIIVFFPLYWMAITAFKERPDVFPLPTFVPWVDFTPTLSAFETIFGQYRSQLVNALKNSAIASILGASVATFVGALAGYALARFKFEKRFFTNDELAFFFISQRMLPPVAVVFPFLLMYRYAGMIDRAWALGIAYALFNLPLAVWITRDAFRAVPKEIEESGLVDGCTRLGVFFKISLPLAFPGIVTAFFVCIIFAWNEFLFALILTFRRSQTLPVLIAGQANELGAYWWIMSALGLIAIVPMLFLGLYSQRWIVRGLSAGGVKG